jgi:hypothetical protein
MPSGVCHDLMTPERARKPDDLARKARCTQAKRR